MKNLKLILALALSIGLFTVSCSNDDNGNNDGETIVPLTGKWKVSKVGSTVGGQEVLVNAPQNQSGCDRDYIQLKSDNTITEGDYDSSVSACNLTLDNGIYSRSHNDLTTVIDGVTTVQDIANLTFTELKLRDKSNGDIIIYTR